MRISFWICRLFSQPYATFWPGHHLAGFFPFIFYTSQLKNNKLGKDTCIQHTIMRTNHKKNAIIRHFLIENRYDHNRDNKYGIKSSVEALNYTKLYKKYK